MRLRGLVLGAATLVTVVAVSAHIGDSLCSAAHGSHVDDIGTERNRFHGVWKGLPHEGSASDKVA